MEQNETDGIIETRTRFLSHTLGDRERRGTDCLKEREMLRNERQSGALQTSDLARLGRREPLRRRLAS